MIPPFSDGRDGGPEESSSGEREGRLSHHRSQGDQDPEAAAPPQHCQPQGNSHR